jgi:predicted SprT family Zn-dependent metalloprotease
MFVGNEMWLNNRLLEMSSRKRLETIIHELAHYLEKRASGQTEGVLDTKEEMRYQFTHQQDGDFAYFYRRVNLVLLQIITNQSSEVTVN